MGADVRRAWCSPKLRKHCSATKHTTNAGVLSSWNSPAGMPTIPPTHAPFAQSRETFAQKSVRAEEQVANTHSALRTTDKICSNTMAK
jgi:hypothetical protein